MTEVNNHLAASTIDEGFIFAKPAKFLHSEVLNQSTDEFTSPLTNFK